MKKAFTLVEIMIVVAIIALLAAIAIPNLLRARMQAQEAAAATAMHTLSAAEQSFRAANPLYATMVQLSGAVPPYIDVTLGGGTKQGYFFVVAGNTATQFYATAAPQSLNGHCYYVDEDGVLCRSDAVACAAAVGAHSDACPAAYAEVQ